MKTYDKNQVNKALETLSEIFENDDKYKALPEQSKETFARALLEACKIVSKTH